ncbi:hypothetical protein D9619_013295 [Psilocybe cf. subviscida]|uniref:Uncharacterized protein n=1 Tax=Psilocybe cf. subviscida TaxID=2480587 RepID=A0A8H5BSJ7_9AGAR|nr:hypothetical protein D9619_013295 [Psilocybe cf. subviscida]
MVLEEKTQVAVVVNANTSTRLTVSFTSPNASYDGTDAVSVHAVEAWNENGPQHPPPLDPSRAQCPVLLVRQVKCAAPLHWQHFEYRESASRSLQIITAPLGYRIANLASFDVPVTTAVTFVGLIYLLVLSFVVHVEWWLSVGCVGQFGHSGFLVFWMLNYGGMPTGGLALEAMLTLFTSFTSVWPIKWMNSQPLEMSFPRRNHATFSYGAPS